MRIDDCRQDLLSHLTREIAELKEQLLQVLLVLYRLCEQLAAHRCQFFGLSCSRRPPPLIVAQVE